MKSSIVTIIIILNIFLIGCGSQTAILMEDYRGEKMSGKDLTIIKLFEKASIANSDDVVDDLGAGVPDEIYISFFNKNFPKAFQNSSCCNKIYYIENFSGSDLKEKVLDINDKEKMKILLPEENSKIENDSISSEFILFIDNLQISRISGQSGTMVGGIYTGGSFGKLYHQIYFALWDNKNGKVAAYGRIEEVSTIVFGMTKSNWESVLEGLASKILYYSPFPVKYHGYY